MRLSLLHKLRVRLLGGLIPEGSLGIRALGYRNYVGGRWEEIGKLQFEYLVHRGLQPEHCFLDVACGALRGGRHFIPYLEPGNYLGLDKEASLIETGCTRIIEQALLLEKRPEFVVSDNFAFGEFSRKPHYALALSLFTHLQSADIELCLRNLRAFVEPGHQFFATFFEGQSTDNPSNSHSLDHFKYEREELSAIGERSGWEADYIGEWNHPRNQMMMRFVCPG